MTKRIVLGLIAFTACQVWLGSLIASLVAGVTTFAMVRSKAPAKLVTITNLETGEQKLQPMDEDTIRYLNSRKD